MDNEPAPAALLLRLIAAREDGEIGGPVVDAKIAELADRVGVVVFHISETTPVFSG